MSIILKAVNISKKYQHNKTILKDTSFTINEGEISVIEGKSGSGKSTFLSILGGMEHPTTGQVLYKNKSLYSLRDNEQAIIRGRAFGFVFQAFNLIPELTVRENIELPLQFNKRRKTQDIKSLADELDIGNQLDKKPPYLSGGEQQRVAIARALITSPEIIFADEPTGNLDQVNSEKIVNILTDLCVKKAVSLVVVTHEKNLFQHPHNLYTMKNGKLQVEKKYV